MKGYFRNNKGFAENIFARFLGLEGKDEIVCKIKMLHRDARLPNYATTGASCLDLYACVDIEEEPIIIHPGEVKLIKTGIAISIPEGYEAQVRSRSGIALKHNVFVLNSPGTIDSDYRGEICVILANFGKKKFKIINGDRIAQLAIVPVVKPSFEILGYDEELDKTERGSNGFGSTGI